MTKKHQQAKLFDPVWTVLLTLGTFFATQFWAGALISPILAMLASDSTSLTAYLQDSPWLMALFYAILAGLTLWTINVLIKLEFGSSLETLGLNKPRKKHVVYVLLGYGAYFLLYVAVVILVKWLIPELDLDKEQELSFSTETTGLPLLAVFFSLVVLPPLVEETLARGFLFGGLRTKLPFIAAAVITSLLFAAAHLGGAKDGLLWVAAIDTFILSIILCYLREKTGSLWPSIGVHMLKNGVAFIILFNIVGVIR